jgi:hypothetical protein
MESGLQRDSKMIVTKNKGLGSIFTSSDCFCSSGSLIATWLGGTCWTIFPCTGPTSSNYGVASDPNTVMPEQWYENNAIIAEQEATGSDPNAPNPNCTSTIITSPIAVCDWLIYLGGAVGAILAFSAFSGRR